MAVSEAGDFLETLLTRAISARASDLHLEPRERGGLAVRLRVDGSLREESMIPEGLAEAVVATLKERARMEVTVRRRPQDGRCTIQLAGERIPSRVSVIPSLHGEAVVVRFLRSGPETETLAGLGMPVALQQALRAMFEGRDGQFLVTGPTGSGKTTTLYALLRELDVAARKIIAVEDPVEVFLPGVTQVPVRAEVGMTFAAALRAALRQSPDLLLIGEIRDPETAKMALEASLTGHLVLATLHTASAADVIPRLSELGLDAREVRASLRGVLAQRLLRKLCPACASRRPADDLTRGYLDLDPLPAAIGCEACAQTGFAGRTGVFVFAEGDEIAAADEPALRARAYELVRAGSTTLEEVLGVCG